MDPEDDVAHVKLGGSWRMPTTDEINELVEKCTWSWASVNGEIGFLITSNIPGYTDRSFFFLTIMPAPREMWLTGQVRLMPAPVVVVPAFGYVLMAM